MGIVKANDDRTWLRPVVRLSRHRLRMLCRCRLASALCRGPSRGQQIVPRVDDADVRKGLRKVAELPLGARVVFFRQEAEVVPERQQSLKKILRLVVAA